MNHEQLVGAVYYALTRAMGEHGTAVANACLRAIAEHSSAEDARILNSIASKSAGYQMDAQPKHKEI